LKKIVDEIKACTKCELCKTATNKVIGRGSFSPKILFVGEAPGAEEDMQGKPFVGRSGMLLENWIEILGLTVNDYAITNVLKCRPPENRDPAPEEIRACLPFLKQQIKLLSPEVIVPLGKFAMQTILNDYEKTISEAVAQSFEVEGVKVFPLFHPAYYLRQGKTGENAELKKLKGFLLDGKEQLEEFIINIQTCDNLSTDEMFSPILSAVHHFCKLSNTTFKDLDQKELC